MAVEKVEEEPKEENLYTYYYNLSKVGIDRKAKTSRNSMDATVGIKHSPN